MAHYRLTLDPSVSLSGSYPTCSIGNNGAVSDGGDFVRVCAVQRQDASHVRVVIYRVDVDDEDSVTREDVGDTLPVVVTIP